MHVCMCIYIYTYVNVDVDVDVRVFIHKQRLAIATTKILGSAGLPASAAE